MFKKIIKLLLYVAIVNMECRLLMLWMSAYYRTSMPKLKLGRMMNGFYGIHKGDVIAVDILTNGTVKECIRTVRHEFRHHWQHKYHSDAVNWWASRPEYSNNQEFYNWCIHEQDARRFEMSNGRLCDNLLFVLLPLKKAKEVYENNGADQLIALCKEISFRVDEFDKKKNK